MSDEKKRIDGGGPAFPSSMYNWTDRNQISPDGQLVPPLDVCNMPGMSRRDWLAGKAMDLAWNLVGQMTISGLESWSGLKYTTENLPAMIAKKAYELADALIAEGKKK